MNSLKNNSFKPETENRYIIRRLTGNDTDKACAYLQALSPESKTRFGPHAFDKETVMNLLNDTEQMRVYGAFEPESGTMISYALIRKGYLHHDQARLESYGLHLSEQYDCTYAPSVADYWQNKGIGGLVFRYILNDLPPHCNRIILWGGVQAGNLLAVNFYLRRNFRICGNFEHNGNNYDMILNL